MSKNEVNPCPHCGKELYYVGAQERLTGSPVELYHCLNPDCLFEVTRTYRELAAIGPAEYVALRKTVIRLQQRLARR